MALSEKILQELKLSSRISLSSCILGDEETDEIVALLHKGLPTSYDDTCLKTLTFNNVTIGSKNLERICEALKKNRTVQRLSFYESMLSTLGARYIADALAANRSLTHLTLHECAIADGGAEAIANALKKNKTLESLSLRKNPIHEQGADSFAELLSSNKSLQALYLNDTEIGSAGASALAHALKKNTTLRALGVLESHADDTAAMDFVEALSSNKTLRYLGLSGDIHAEGMKAIGDAVKTHPSLCALDLSGNHMDDNVLSLLMERLHDNQSLTDLILTRCGLSDSGASSVADMLRANATLLHLNIGYNDLTTAGLKEIAEALKTHKLAEFDFTQLARNESKKAIVLEALKNSENLMRCPSLWQSMDDQLEANRETATELIDKLSDSEDLSKKELQTLKSRLPSILWAILERGHKSFEDAAVLLERASRQAASMGIDIVLPLPWQHAADEAKIVIPRSNAPFPVRLDRTITSWTLMSHVKTYPKSNLQIFSEQGQLADVFSPEIWYGRRQEMDEAWKLVSPQYQSQVDIESVRALLEGGPLHDRFKPKDSGRQPGF